MAPTNRIYTEKQTGTRFRMYCDDTTGARQLMNEETGETVKAFYTCAFTDVYLKFTNRIEKLNVGEFIRLGKDRPTHYKFSMEKRFKKL